MGSEQKPENPGLAPTPPLTIEVRCRDLACDLPRGNRRNLWPRAISGRDAPAGIAFTVVVTATVHAARCNRRPRTAEAYCSHAALRGSVTDRAALVRYNVRRVRFRATGIVAREMWNEA